MQAFHRLRRKLVRQVDGVSAIEFAIVAPVLICIIMAIIELSYYAYATSVLRGSVAEAGRNSALESGAGGSATIDAKVTSDFHAVSPQATLSFARKAYDSYGNVGKAEPYSDDNGNGNHDADECFTDINNNGSWDADQGVDGQGGATRVVEYTATARYYRLFPLTSWFGMNEYMTVSASSQLVNQPYAMAESALPKVICP